MRTVRLRNPVAMGVDARFLNVLQLGFGFFVLFTAYQSCSQIQAKVLGFVSKNNTGPVDSNGGYYSSAIIYGVFTLFNFFAAALVGVTTAKWSMVLGGCTYALFLASFLYVRSAFLYSTSALLGVGAAMIWVGQGQYLTKNSDDETMGRNSAITWAMLQCSLPVGGIFLYALFSQSQSDQLTDDMIRIIYIVFTCMAGAGVLILALLRRPPRAAPTAASASTNYAVSIDVPDDPHDIQVQGVAVAGTPATNTKEEEGGELMKPNAQKNEDQEGFVESFVQTFKLLKTLPMLLLAVVFIYTGLEQTFWSGVYGTCLARTQAFGAKTANELLAINSIFLGLGEIVGGGIFGILGKRIHTHIGRSPIVLLGMIVHVVSFVLIFINTPADAPLTTEGDSTPNTAYITPNEYLAIFCGFLLGFADSCWNTQVYSLLGTFYSENSAHAFALFKFFQSGASCGGFFYSGHVLLHWQLLILLITCILGGLAFFKVNHMAQQAASRNMKAA